MEKLKQVTVFLIAAAILSISIWYGAPIVEPVDFNNPFYSNPPEVFQYAYSFLWCFFSVSLALMYCKKITWTLSLLFLVGLIIIPIPGVLEFIRVGEAENQIPYGKTMPDWLAGLIYYFVNEVRFKLIAFGFFAIFSHFMISVLVKNDVRKTLAAFTIFSFVVCVAIWQWQFSNWTVSLLHLGLFILSLMSAVIINIFLDIDKERLMIKKHGQETA